MAGFKAHSYANKCWHNRRRRHEHHRCPHCWRWSDRAHPAASLVKRGISTTLVDRQAAGANTSRAGVVNARLLEVLEDLDVARRLVKEGVQAPDFTIRDRQRTLIQIDFSELPTAYAYSLLVPQSTTEKLLLDRLVELGGTVIRPKTLTAVEQDADGVTATFDDGDTIRARYLVGADGIHSTVREQAGIGFEGGQYDESFALADVHSGRRGARRRGDPVLGDGRSDRGRPTPRRRRVPHRRAVGRRA